MPKYASENSREIIGNEIKDLAEGFFGKNANNVDEELKGWLDGITNPMDKVSKFEFVGSKDKNAGLQSELKESFDKIMDFLTGANNERGKPFDYDIWNKNISKAIPGFMEKLDSFNEATDYSYITTPEMRALNTFMNKLSNTDVFIQNCEYSEPLNEINKSADDLKKEQDELNKKADEYLLYCKMGQMSAETLARDLSGLNELSGMVNRFANVADREIPKLEKEKAELEKEQSFERAFQGVSYALLEKKDMMTKHDKVNEYLFKYNNLDITLFDQPNELREALQVKAGLNKLSRENKLDDVESFLEVDPESKNDLDEEEFEKYKNDIQKMAPDDFKKYVDNLLQNSDKTIKSYENTESKDFIDSFLNRENIRDELGRIDNKISALDASIKKGSVAMNEIAKATNNPVNVVELVQKEINRVDSYSDTVAAKMKKQLGEMLQKPQNEGRELGLVNKAINTRKELAEYSKNNAEFLMELGSKASIAKEKANEVNKAQNTFNKNREKFERDSLIMDPSDKLRNVSKSALDRFASQMDKCKRFGHSNSDEFKKMQDAVENARKDPTIDNMKKMKEAADQYLDAKKGGQTFFNTKMRRHRLELAKSISEFGASCENLDYTLGRAKETKQKADETLGGLNKDVIGTLKNDPKYKGGNILGEHVEKISQMNDVIKMSENELFNIKLDKQEQKIASQNKEKINAPVLKNKEEDAIHF